mgnify:CR=1 FL=1
MQVMPRSEPVDVEKCCGLAKERDEGIPAPTLDPDAPLVFSFWPFCFFLCVPAFALPGSGAWHPLVVAADRKCGQTRAKPTRC